MDRSPILLCPTGAAVAWVGIRSRRGTEGGNLTTRSLSEYRGAWAEWLSKVFQDQPVTLATLTFAPRPWERSGVPGISRVQRAGRKFAALLTASLAGPSYFLCMEVGSWNGRRHLHSMIYCPDESVIREALARHRTEGFFDLSHRPGSVVEYVTKYVSKSDTDFWLAGGPLWRSTD